MKFWLSLLIGCVCGATALVLSDLAVTGIGLMLGTSVAAVFVWLASVALAYAPEKDLKPARRGKSDELPKGFGRALLEQISIPLILISERGPITYANSAARKALPRLETGAHYVNLFRVPAFIEPVSQVLADGRARTAEFALFGTTDQHLEARINLLPSSTDLGRERQVIVLIQDQTDAHLLEQKRKDFISNASHELRTPLATIMGYVETLLGHAKDDEEAREKFLGVIDREAHRMQRLVEGLMSLNKIELLANERPTERHELVDIIKETIAAMRPLVARTGAQLKDETQALTQNVICDRDQLQQVISNLIDNALKYGGEQVEVGVSIAAPDPRYPNMVGITVSDNGPGIAGEHLLRLTERFYRVNAGASRSAGGTGLGLAIVKHILNRHDGELSIASDPEIGSRFTFWLPIHDDSSG